MTEEELMMAVAAEDTYSDVYYGKCLMTFWEGKWPRNAEGKITGAPVRWVEGDSEKEKLYMIDFLLDLLPGCSANYQVKAGWMKHDKDFKKIVVPSLIECGAATNGTVDFRKVKDHWVKVEQVEGTRPREKGNPDKGFYKTYKFLAIYKDQAECAKAMALDNGEDMPSSAPNADDQRRAAALQFCEVAVSLYKGQEAAKVREGMKNFIDTNPNVKPFVSISDPEIEEMIADAASEPPF